MYIYIMCVRVYVCVCIYVKRDFDSFHFSLKQLYIIYVCVCAYVCVCKEIFSDWSSKQLYVCVCVCLCIFIDVRMCVYVKRDFDSFDWSSVLVSDQCLLQTEQSNLKNTVRWFQVQTSSDLVSCFFLSVCD